MAQDTVETKRLAPRLAIQHCTSQFRQGRIVLDERIRQYTLDNQARAVGMNDKGPSPTHHHAIGLRERMADEDGVGEPLHRHINREHAYHLALGIVERQTTGGHDGHQPAAVGVVLGEGLYPVFLVQLARDQVLVGVEVLIPIVAFLFGDNTVAIAVCVSGEVSALGLEIVGLEGDAATRKIGMVLQQQAAIAIHRVRIVELLLNGSNRPLNGFLHLVDHQEGLVHDAFQRLDGSIERHLLRLRAGENQRRHRTHSHQGSQEHEQPLVSTGKILKSLFHKSICCLQVRYK